MVYQITTILHIEYVGPGIVCCVVYTYWKLRGSSVETHGAFTLALLAALSQTILR